MKIKTIVMSAGGPCSRALTEWLSRHTPDFSWGSTDYGIDHARNQNVRRFLAEDVAAGYSHLLMIDSDMVPINESILTDVGDLVYCGYNDRWASPGHFGDNDFGSACFRASAYLLAKMPDPWFKMHYEDGVRKKCECKHFRDQAAEVGFKPKMVGVIGHQQTCVLVPSLTDGSPTIHWPFQFEAQ